MTARAQKKEEIAFIPMKGEHILVTDRASVSYWPAGWSWGGRLGQKMGPQRDRASWRFPQYGVSNPDVRAIPLEAQEYLTSIARQIDELWQQRRDYLADNFRTWPIVRKEDVRQGVAKTRAQVIAEHAS